MVFVSWSVCLQTIFWKYIEGHNENKILKAFQGQTADKQCNCIHISVHISLCLFWVLFSVLPCTDRYPRIPVVLIWYYLNEYRIFLKTESFIFCFLVDLYVGPGCTQYFLKLYIIYRTGRNFYQGSNFGIFSDALQLAKIVYR